MKRIKFNKKKDQNKQHRITDEPLPIGTKVYVSTLGMNDKLYPKYRGPFTIIERTQYGNYIIENLLKERISGTFPLQRLKVVKGKQTEQYYRIDKILNDRKVGGKIEVLIKWQGCGNDQNTWEPLSNLSDPDMFRKYLDKKKQKNHRTVTKSISYLSTILALFLFLPLAVAANPQKASNSIAICEDPGEEPWTLPLLLTENGCMDWSSKDESNSSKFFKKGEKAIEASIILQEAYKIKGHAYECSMTKISVREYENFFGADKKERTEISLPISKQQCEDMVKYKKCNNEMMICNEYYKNSKDKDYLDCYYEPVIKDEFQWLVNNVDVKIACSINTIYIAENSLDTEIFGCKMEDNFCVHRNNTIIWDSNLYKRCPYNFDSQETKLWNIAENDIIESNGHYLKINEKLNTTNCNGAVLYKTAEGLYLAEGDNINKLENGGVEVSKESQYNSGYNNHKILSEVDGLEFRNIKNQDRIKHRLCENLLTTLNTIKVKNNYYMRINDPTLNLSTIVYADQGAIWIPKCFKIEEFEVISDNTNCYEDIPIRIFKTNKSLTVYLKENRVAVKNSKIKNCNQKTIRIISENEKHLILTNENQMTSIKNISNVARLYSLENTIYKYNFEHYRSLIENYDLIAMINSKENKINKERKNDDIIIASKISSRKSNFTGFEFIQNTKQYIMAKALVVRDFFIDSSKLIKKIAIYASIGFALLFVISLILTVAIICFKNYKKQRFQIKEQIRLIENPNKNSLSNVLRENKIYKSLNSKK